jgi:hypothetical protein
MGRDFHTFGHSAIETFGIKMKDGIDFVIFPTLFRQIWLTPFTTNSYEWLAG